jgi:hypothetical protein
MKHARIVLVAVSISLIHMNSVAIAKETPIKRDQVPSAVEKALDARYPGAEVLGLTKESAKFGMEYEAELKVGGRRVDALFDEKGALREEETTLAVSELPEAVRLALAHSAHAHAVLKHAERIGDGTTRTAPRYELLVLEGTQYFEFVYGADGRLMSGRKTDAND